MRLLVGLIVLLTSTSLAHAQEWFIFPNDGQSQEQQDQDEFQCIRLASDQSGFDPMATPTATRAEPGTRGSVLGGAIGGAVVGTTVGAIAGNSRRGFRTGAATGGLMGGMRRADSQQQQNEWSQEQTATYQANRDRFTRAFTACMQSRGYTVG